jgi:hypothetical protein
MKCYTISKPRPSTLKPVELRIALQNPGVPPTWASLQQSLGLNAAQWAPVFTWAVPATDQLLFRILIQ